LKDDYSGLKAKKIKAVAAAALIRFVDRRRGKRGVLKNPAVPAPSSRPS